MVNINPVIARRLTDSLSVGVGLDYYVSRAITRGEMNYSPFGGPGEVDLDIKGVECDLEINGKPFAYGISNAQVQVPAFGSETIPVQVYSSVLDIVRGLFGLPQREDLSYRAKGRVRMEGGGLMPSALPFDSQGTVSIKDLAPGRKSPS